MRVLNIKKGIQKRKTRPKGEHFTKNFTYRNIKTDMHDHMLKNVLHIMLYDLGHGFKQLLEY